MASPSALCQAIVERLVAAAFADAVIRFGGGREKTYALTATGSSVAVDLANGNTQVLTLQSNTTVSFTGATDETSCTVSLYLVQDATGGRSVTWPAGVRWPGGTPPTISSAANARDLVVLETLDGGATWDAVLSGLAFS